MSNKYEGYDFRPWSARNINWLAPLVVAAGVGVMVGAFSVLPWIQARISPPQGEGLAPLYNQQAPTVPLSVEVFRPRFVEKAGTPG